MRAGIKLLFAVAFLAISLPVQAHIGTTTVFYEGDAGPYQVRITIQPPEVVPGLAQINVRVHNGTIKEVGALPVRWDAGRKGAPPPDIAALVKGETNLFSTQLWLMNFGAYSVFVDIDGSLGKGTAIVPLNSVSSQRLPMPKWMGTAFLVAGAILVLLLVCIIGSAVRESVLPIGETPGAKQGRRARIAMAAAFVLIVGVLFIGKRWWDKVDADFRNNRLYKPVQIESSLAVRDNARFLNLRLDRNRREWRDHTPLVADHGKLMHLFLVREPGLDAFAHMHPGRKSADEFESMVNALPKGRYAVYADVVHESGLAQTLVSSVDLPEGEFDRNNRSDEDDSTWYGEASEGTEAKFANGTTVKWLNAVEPEARKEVVLRFEVLAGDGKPAPLEPYMGMWSHAVIRSMDGSVFTHLHPSGTISMTSQELFARRERGEKPTAKPLDVVCGRPERELRFPFSFPRPGEYRVWVQVRTLGEIVTGAFKVHVN